MKLSIQKEIAQERHPEEINSFLLYLRSSNTKSKDVLFENFKYEYFWMEKLGRCGLEDFYKKKKRINRHERTSSFLKIKAGRVIKFYPLKTLPIEVFNIQLSRGWYYGN